jgi:hypothetical protein
VLAIVFFNMRPEVAPARRERLLRELESRPEVSMAAAMRPDAKNELFRRMYYADVSDETAAVAVVRHLSLQPEVESASVPAERHLAEA